MIDIDDSMLDQLKTADYDGFIKMGMQYADSVINGNEESPESFIRLINEISGKEKIDIIGKSENSEDIEESYYNLYNDLVG
jgi:starch synthase